MLIKSSKFFNIFADVFGHRCLVLSIILVSTLLQGCISEAWTGASLIYDRHNVYIKLSEFQLGAMANRALFRDKLFKRDDCSIELAIFNSDILMVGQVPTEALYQEATSRINALPGKRRFYNQLTISTTPRDPLLDSWITTKIRSQIFADSSIDPHQFKIVTCNQIVYVMGDVIPIQAKKVILFARRCNSVKRVVTLLKFYNLSDKPNTNIGIGK